MGAPGGVAELVYCYGLENRRWSNSSVGSNPTPASKRKGRCSTAAFLVLFLWLELLMYQVSYDGIRRSYRVRDFDRTAADRYVACPYFDRIGRLVSRIVGSHFATNQQ